jgi:hypothetical protein
MKSLEEPLNPVTQSGSLSQVFAVLVNSLHEIGSIPLILCSTDITIFNLARIVITTESAPPSSLTWVHVSTFAMKVLATLCTSGTTQEYPVLLSNP